MMPIINKSSEKIINVMINDLPQSLLLTGPDGVGLGTIANYIAKLMNATPIVFLPEKDEKVDLEKGTISIDIIRRLYDQTKTKSDNINIFIIDYAERMTVQAQNAFLKLLEEPGKNTYFIIASHSASKLLPTIKSRAETIEIKPINSTQSQALLDQLNVNDTKKRSQLLFMAEGLPAELTRLSSDDNYFDIRSQMVRDARELLQGGMYQRLIIAQKYKDNRPGSLKMLLDAINILKKSTSTNPQISNIVLMEKLLDSYERIEANGNIRLHITRSFI